MRQSSQNKVVDVVALNRDKTKWSVCICTVEVVFAYVEDVIDVGDVVEGVVEVDN